MTQPGDGEHAGQLDVTVVADLRGFATRLRREVNRAAEKAVARVRVAVHRGGFRADLDRVVREAAAKSQVRVQVGVRVSVVEMRRAVREAADKAAVKVQVDADTSPAIRTLARLQRQTPRLRLNSGGLVSGLRRVASGLTSVAAVAVKGAGLAVVSAGATAAAGSLASLTAAIVPAVGALGLVPAAVGAFVAVSSTLKVATAGVGDAIGETWSAHLKMAAGAALSAAEQEKLQEVLDSLSPSARAFVTELQTMFPAFQQLKLDVQERFFTGLGVAARLLGGTYLPTVRSGLAGIAAEVNSGVLAAIGELNTQASASQLGTFLTNSGTAAGIVAAAVGSVVRALLTVSSVGSSFLPGLASGFRDAADEFAGFVERAAADGSLQQWIGDALTVLRQLAALGGDVSGIIGGILEAANTASGGGALGVLGQLVGMLNEAVNSAAGQQALISFFTALGTVGQALGPVLRAVVSALGQGGLFTIIADLATGVSPGLVTLIGALGDGLVALAPAAGPVGDALSAVAVAVAPLLPMLGRVLADALQAAAALLPVLATALAPLIPLVADLAVQFSGQLLPALLPLLPALLEVARVAVAQLLPILPRLVSDGIALAKAFLDLTVAVLPLLPPVIALVGWLLRITTQVMGAGAAVQVAIAGIRAVTGVIGWLVGAFRGVGGFLSQVWSVIVAVGSGIGRFFTTTLPGWIGTAVAWLAGLPARVGAVLAALPGLLIGLVRSALSRAVYWVGFGIGLIIGFFLRLPGRVSAAWTAVSSAVANGVAAVIGWVRQLPGRVAAFASATWDRARVLFSAGVAAVVGLVRDLPGRVSTFAAATRDRVVSAFTVMWARAKEAVRSGVSTVVQWIKGLPSKVGDLSSRLVSAGKDLVRGLISGIRSMGSAAAGAVSGLVDNAVRGAKDALGIASPSRVFRVIGEQVVAGYTTGIDRGAGRAARSAEQLAAATTAGFNPVSPTAGEGGQVPAGPLVGSVTLLAQPGQPVRDQIDEVLWQLRRIQRGGLAGAS